MPSEEPSPEDELPESPVTELNAEAITHYEYYLAWRRAGFSSEQSIDLLKNCIQTEMYIAAEADEEES